MTQSRSATVRALYQLVSMHKPPAGLDAEPSARPVAITRRHAPGQKPPLKTQPPRSKGWRGRVQSPQSIPTEAARRCAPVCPRRVPFGKLTTAHSASRAQFGVLVAHLDQCGILGARSTVARGGRGLRVRLHLFSCERKEAVTGTRRLRLHGGSGTQAGYNGDHLKQLLSPRSTCCSRGS